MVSFGMSRYMNVNRNSSVYIIKDMTVWRQIQGFNKAEV